MTINDALLHLDHTFELEKNSGFCMESHLNISKPICIYGAGNWGANCLHILNKHDITPYAFLDRYMINNKEYQNIPVYHPDDKRLSTNLRAQCTVILALYLETDSEKEKVITFLYELGYQDILYDMSFLSDNHAFSLGCETEEIEFDKEEIYKTAKILYDEESRIIFTQHIRCHWQNNYETALQISEGEIYFEPNFKMARGLSKIVDCGANTGQTWREKVVLQHCNFYIGFEPDSVNFKSLSKHAKTLSEKINQVFLYPVAVSEMNDFLCFDARGNGASKLSKDGKSLVQTVRLDDVLAQFKPTLIKMDIEGAELGALKGCERIIKSFQPDLAICLYHKISDLWKIPQLIHSYVPEYNIAIRVYSYGTWETVMYASIF